MVIELKVSPPRVFRLAVPYEMWQTLACVSLRHSSSTYCPGHAGVKGNDRADRLAGKTTITGGLRLGRSEVLRSLRHKLRAQMKDTTPSIARRRDRGVERGSAQRFSLKDRERAIVDQINNGSGRHVFLSYCIATE